jgi:hypothetical protein
VFARDVFRQAAPDGQERAKNLHPSVAERFARCAPGLSGVARRTLRTNLQFTGRRATPENPQTAPQAPRRPRRQATLTRNRRDHEPRTRHHHQHSRHDQAKASPDTGQTRAPRTTARPKTPAPDHELPSKPECQTKT